MKSNQNILFRYQKNEVKQPLNNLMSSVEIRDKMIQRLESYLVRVI